MSKYYAQLDADNVCVGVQESPASLTADNLIEVDGLDADWIGRKREGEGWSTDKVVAESDPIADLMLALAEAEEARLESEQTIMLALAEIAEGGI